MKIRDIPNLVLWAKLACLIAGHKWVEYYRNEADYKRYCDRCGRAEGVFNITALGGKG